MLIMDFYGMDYLKGKLSQKQNRVNLRYSYYDMKNKAQEVSKLIPQEFKSLSFCSGWCAKAADSIADRLIFDEFDNDILYMDEIYSMNNSDVLFDSAILSAAITSCCFVYIDHDDAGYPKLQVIDGANATGIIDPTTMMLKEGYAVLSRDADGKEEMEAYFVPHRTEYYEKGKLIDVYEHDAPYPLLVPIIYRPDAKRPFGHSRISRSCMALQQAAMRTLLRTEVAAEFYSVPQKYVVGLAKNAEFNQQLATYSSFLTFSADPKTGDQPKLGQFDAHSMEPHIANLRMLASMFSGETGLTLDDLGFTTDNPSSSEAIKAAHENLRLAARKAQRTFSTGFINAGYLAACIRDEQEYARTAIRDTVAIWQPIFDNDLSSIGAFGDMAFKVNEVVPGFIDEKMIHRLTGL